MKTRSDLYIFVGLLDAEYDDVMHWVDVARHFNENEKIHPVALLHDVVEDGFATMEYVVHECELDDEQAAALDAITRRKEEKYFDYIARVKQNKMATKVKLADLKENIKRCASELLIEGVISDKWGLLRRYAKAYAILTNQWKEHNKK